MRKRVFLAVLMIAALVLSTSCSLIVKDSEVDKGTVIIQVAGKTITKAEVQSALEDMLSYQEYMYSMYGYQYDRTDAATIAAAQDSTIQSLIQNAVINQKLAELGFDTFSDAELAELQATVDTTYQGYVDSVTKNYFADTTLTGDELTQAIQAKMTELAYPTKDSLLATQKATKSQEKLKNSVVKDVTVSDEEIQAEYDAAVESAKSSYADSLTQYASDVNSGATIYYRPAGYRYVKNLLVKLSDENSTAISDLQTQISDKQTALDTNTTSLAALPADAATDTEDQAKSRQELTSAKTQLESDIADLNGKLETLKNEAYAALQPTVDEISAKLATGEDFDALLAQYGQDTGMQTEPAKTEGYPVCVGDTLYVTEFTDAAMALAKVGDVSAPFRTDFGIHFVKYISDLAEGAVPLADLKDTISASLLTTKQDDAYNAAVSDWVTAANAKIYKDRLAD